MVLYILTTIPISDNKSITDEPSGPFGAKSVAEIAIDGVAPAIVSAIHDATGIWIRELPATLERVWHAIRSRAEIKK